MLGTYYTYVYLKRNWAMSWEWIARKNTRSIALLTIYQLTKVSIIPPTICTYELADSITERVRYF